MSEPMTREEACEVVQRVVSLLDGALDADNAEPWRNIGKAQGLLASVLAALSSPCDICGGKEPRAEGAGIVHMHGQSGYVAPHIKLYAIDGFKDGQLVTAYVFEEPPEEGRHEQD